MAVFFLNRDPAEVGGPTEKAEHCSTLVPRFCPKWHIPESILSMFYLSIPHISGSAASQKLVYGALQIFLER